MKSMHELLVQTYNEIDRRGHAKGTLEDPQGQVCLYGGFCAAAYGFPDYLIVDPLQHIADMHTIQYHNDAFAAALGFPNSIEAVCWNNAPERTKEEVLARLAEAIARTAPAPEDPLPVGVSEVVTI